MTTMQTGRDGVAHHARCLADYSAEAERLLPLAEDGDAEARAELAWIAQRIDGHQARLVRAFGEWASAGALPTLAELDLTPAGERLVPTLLATVRRLSSREVAS